jgi:hypothetical protein
MHLLALYSFENAWSKLGEEVACVIEKDCFGDIDIPHRDNRVKVDLRL